MQDSGSLAVFKVTARDQGHYKGPSGHLSPTVTFLVGVYTEKVKFSVSFILLNLKNLVYFNA